MIFSSKTDWQIYHISGTFGVAQKLADIVWNAYNVWSVICRFDNEYTLYKYVHVGVYFWFVFILH